MNGLKKIEFVQALMAMFIPNVGALLVIMAVNADQTDIFSEFKSPRWMPPVWLIAAIWCAFFCVIGCASNIVFNHRELMGKWSALTKASLISYGAHLVLSWFWGMIIFYRKNIILGAIDMVLVNVTALHTTCLFYKVKSLAGYLFMPYLFWLSFVTVLNCSIIAIN